MEQIALRLGLYETNCYVLWDPETKIGVLTDPGYEAGRILAELEQRHIQLAAVLLTHGHFDHVGRTKEIREATGCKIYVHPADLDLPVYMRNGLTYTDFYNEGDVLDFGPIRVEVLHTPGHSKGSVCLKIGDDLYTGDTLFAGGCGRTDCPGGSWNEICASLRRLGNLPGDYRIWPGHGGSSTLARERLGNVFLRRAMNG